MTRIDAVRSRALAVPLSRPYAIACGTCSSVDLCVVEIGAGGRVGFGQASPAPEVTGETVAQCQAALQPGALGWLLGREVGEAWVAQDLRRVPTPAARAAVDMALLDLLGQAAGQPAVEFLGRRHAALPTSITIGIKDRASTLAEAEEYCARGFSVLKVKTGLDAGDDLERLRALRRRFGNRVVLRADANQGYDAASLRRFVAGMEDLDLELLEQPLPRGQEDALRSLPDGVRRRLVADESVHGADDLRRLVAAGCPFGVVNVKLMKCGGPLAARELAAVAEAAGIHLMWGCMDESVVGIAAALHTAMSCAATRWLDLDGSFDLAADPFTGGFDLADGSLRPLAAPGLGARRA
jgi:L-alanine-DL-glutamate epimerase-like enolase superfamily enzyme